MPTSALATSTGAVLFDRRCRLVIAPPVLGSLKLVKTQQAFTVEDLKVKFKLAKSLRKEPNTGTIEVWGLNADHRGLLKGKGARCWLEAGYQSGTFQLFGGDIRFPGHRHDGPEWISKLELGDGERAYRYGRCNVAFKAGTSKYDALKELARQSGWDLGNVPDFAASLGIEQYTNGYSASGSVVGAIDEVLNGQGLSWSIQNGKIQILPLTGYIPSSAVLLDADHGLIGSPEYGASQKPGTVPSLKVKALIQPGLDPGKLINLVSEEHRGIFIIQKVDIDGDSEGGDWYCACECLPQGGQRGKLGKAAKNRKTVGKR
jgi:hypothetical protein